MPKNVWLSTADGNYGTAANWSLGHVPAAAEDVIIPVASPAITGGLDQSGVAIGGFFVEDGYSNPIGGASGYLSILPSSLFFGGTARSFINVNSANITIDVYNTADKTQAQDAGLYLLGSNIATVNVYKGHVGLAAFAGETATVATINLMYLTMKVGQSSFVVGPGVSLTNWNQSGGSGLLRAAAATVTVTDGELSIRGSGAITNLNNEGGVVYPEASGTIANLNMRRGTTDFTRWRATRAVTIAKIWPNAAVAYDPTVVTMTNGVAPQMAVQLSANPAV